MAIIHQDNLDERARNLEASSLNGLRMVLVHLIGPDTAQLELHFWNAHQVAAIAADIAGDPTLAVSLFPISGGHRLRAGSLPGQVQVTSVAAAVEPDRLILTVEPIGDYSTYTLGVVFPNIDPLFSSLPFKFRPGCFTADCAPEWEPGTAPKPSPTIDYLAKDYDSFRHTLIAAMMQRVPGWQSTSEADFDQVLIDLLAASGDELSDYQDRVMNEAYLATARKRVSLARHARLVDYHIHQGNQASTWLALEINTAAGFTLPEHFLVWTGELEPPEDAVFFATRREHWLHPLFNSLQLHTWSDSIPALAAGSTQADLVPSQAGQVAADIVRDAIREGRIPRLLIQEHLNPATGNLAGRDITKRQLVRLIPGLDPETRAETMQDPLAGTWFVRVHWDPRDQLQRNYCFVVFCPNGRVGDVSLFHGNLAQGHEGAPLALTFVDPEQGVLAVGEQFYERSPANEVNRGVICRLPENPLAYLPTPPDGETPAQSTLRVEVEVPGGGIDPWDEVISLIHSDDSSEQGDHFVVETDEGQRSLVRFGNGVNGRSLPERARVHCRYQIGGSTRGNVGADTLLFFDLSAVPEVTRAWNPFDVTNGRDPEPRDEIIRQAPEAFRARQLRAVTLLDYVRRAEEVPGVSRAAARYAWTGSWRTVRVAIDPVGATDLGDSLRSAVFDHLEALRLIGEDLELRSPIFVPLEIDISICLHPDFWAQDIQFILEQEFSEGYTPDGRRGFFHPDNWTFGQSLRASEIAGRIHQVTGIAHIVSIAMKRWNDPSGVQADLVEASVNEILRVRNDPDHLEEGFINFEVKGGRQ